MPHSPVSPRLAEAVHTVLDAKGFDLDDFELEEDAVPPDDEWLDTDGRLLRIRCISTGEERIYATGAASAWLGAFLMDLGRGHFAAALRVEGDDADLDPAPRVDDSPGLHPVLA